MSMGSRRILVVDGDHSSCDLISYFLKSLGYRVATAPDGNRALNVGVESDIELVILEAHLAIYTGVEVVAMLRGRHLMRPVKILALTADQSIEVREAFERVGVDGYLTKPVNLEYLRGEVDRLMAGQARHDLGLFRRALEREMGRSA